MLTEKQMERYADVLLWGLQTARKTHLKKGDRTQLRTGSSIRWNMHQT